MPTLEMADGALRVTYPNSYIVPPPRPGAAQRRGVSGALLDAFAAQRLVLVEPFELAPANQAGVSAGLKRPPRRTAKVQIELDLPEDQDAVVMLEQDGFFSWRLPHENESAPKTLPRVVRFKMDVIGRVQAYVLKFASRFVPGAVMSFLERHTNAGLVLMKGLDVKRWQGLDNLGQVPLPQDRSARILLFVHGTFSSTVGSYGMLTSTPEGKRFLKAAGLSYYAVVGFDHRTLSRDPLENATDLQSRLKAQHLTFTPRVDIVSYSRGALVARSLIEYLLPSSTWPMDIGKVVFVAGTNAGTLLAEPDNWRHLLDLYTNLAADTMRSIERLTGPTPAPQMTNGMVTGIGPFLRCLVLFSPKGRLLPGLIPGLAAMRPDGPFINGINATQPGQPAPGTPWYVISSDFEPAPAGGAQQPGEQPALALKLADDLADRLMGTKNDLVVDTASMASVDLPSGGGFI
ncbi:MAG: hypothetical protein QOF35_1741, partial [Actinomycetota bacterium]|nr:hypothetical protein [Actinomycetota bacterium]